MTKVLIADHHTLVRAGIRSLLEAMPGIKVVGEAVDGREALSEAKKHHPDIVFTELLLPNLNGLDVAERMRREVPGVKVLMLTSLGGEEYVSQALAAGASGYIVKDGAVSELTSAIDALNRGEIYLSPSISRRAVTRAKRRGRRRGTNVHVTERQKEILKLIAEGKTSKQIAIGFGLSVKTVETHRMRIMDRLQIYDVPGLVRYALREGITSL